jgi:hypothetical protein
VEHVHHHLQIIEHDPLTRRKTVDRNRAHGMVFLQTRFNFSGDGFEMRFGRGGADDKKIGERGNSAQIEDDDVFGLLIRGKLGAGGG